MKEVLNDQHFLEFKEISTGITKTAMQVEKRRKSNEEDCPKICDQVFREKPIAHFRRRLCGG